MHRERGAARARDGSGDATADHGSVQGGDVILRDDGEEGGGQRGEWRGGGEESTAARRKREEDDKDERDATAREGREDTHVSGEVGRLGGWDRGASAAGDHDE